GVDVAERADEARRALGFGYAGERGEELLVVAQVARFAIALGAGVSGRMHSRLATERVHLEPRVLRDAGEPRRLRVGHGLDAGVLLERGAVFLGLVDGEVELVEAHHLDAGAVEDLAQLAELAGVGGGDEEAHRRNISRDAAAFTSGRDAFAFCSWAGGARGILRAGASRRSAGRSSSPRGGDE